MTQHSLRKSAFPIALFSVFAISSVAGVMGKFPFQKNKEFQSKQDDRSMNQVNSLGKRGFLF